MSFMSVFIMLSRLFIAALWSPEGKGLTDLLARVCGVYCAILYPGTGVVLYWIDSWSLLSFLLILGQQT